MIRLAPPNDPIACHEMRCPWRIKMNDIINKEAATFALPPHMLAHDLGV